VTGNIRQIDYKARKTRQASEPIGYPSQMTWDLLLKRATAAGDAAPEARPTFWRAGCPPWIMKMGYLIFHPESCQRSLTFSLAPRTNHTSRLQSPGNKPPGYDMLAGIFQPQEIISQRLERA
jgi:hypothetical protein